CYCAARANKEMTTHFLGSLYALLALAATLSTGGSLYSLAWAEAPCEIIRFNAGASSATISGSIDPDATACFSFAADNGQTVRIAIQSKDGNTMFSVVGLADARDVYEFNSQKSTYEIFVGQLMKSVTADTYQLTVSME